MTIWLRWEITWHGDHGFRTCLGCGVTDYMPITFLVASWSISVNALVHTKNMRWSGWCIKEISQQSRVMYTGYIQTSSNSHSKWCSGCIGTLLAVIFWYDGEDVGGFCWRKLGAFRWLDHWEWGYELGHSGWTELAGRGRELHWIVGDGNERKNAWELMCGGSGCPDLLL
jgi:hypothetical protein